MRGSGRFLRDAMNEAYKVFGAVSIPFIAGQWSLQEAADRERAQERAFQSPSLRGSGRFTRTCRASGCPSHVSIPFIAGQWSLHVVQRVDERTLVGFQSPSLRGSGRFPRKGRSVRSRRVVFQSPSLRGSGRFAMQAATRALDPVRFNPLHCGAVVASRWRLVVRRRSARFNPLHCGAVVASTAAQQPT